MTFAECLDQIRSIVGEAAFVSLAVEVQTSDVNRKVEWTVYVGYSGTKFHRSTHSTPDACVSAVAVGCGDYSQRAFALRAAENQIGEVPSNI